MSSGPASEVDAFKRSVQGGFRNHMKNQMHFYRLQGLYFHFRWALHEKRQYFNFGPFPNTSSQYTASHFGNWGMGLQLTEHDNFFIQETICFLLLQVIL